MPNLVSMWAVGVANLIFTTVGLMAVATILGFPLFLGAAAMGVQQESVARILAYSAPVWAPIGAGFGLFTVSRLFKGIRSGAESEPKNEDSLGSLGWVWLAAVAAIVGGAYLLISR